MRKKLLVLLLALLSVCAVFSMVACSGGIKITPDSVEYDIGTGGDLEVTVDTGGEKLTRIRDGETVVDPTEYLFDAESGSLKIYESYMLYIEQGEHIFTLATEKGEGTLTVNVVNNIQTTFDTSDKNYEYGSNEDIVIDADLSTATITSVRAGSRRLTQNDYSYDATAKKFTIKASYCQTLYGTTEFTVALSNNTEYTFNIISDCMFAANFDDDSIPEFYNALLATTSEGWNGTQALHWTGNGGNLMIFYSGSYTYGLKMDFDTSKLYKLTFQFKNIWEDEGTPEGFVGMNSDDANIFYMDYFTQEVDGGVATCDADGVWSVTIYFYGCQDGKFTNLYTGYDPANPNKKLFDLLFDNIVLMEAEDRDPVMVDTEKTISRGSAEADIWFDGEFGLSKVESVSTGGSALAEGNYTVKASSIVLSKDYVNSLTEDTTFTVTFENGKTVSFAIKMGKSLPTVFDEENEREYEFGSGDVVFDVNFRGFPVLNVKLGDTVLPESAYELDGSAFTIKQAYLDTLAGKNDFVVTVDNAGEIEGVTEAETHAFTITSNALTNIRFEGIDALSNATYAGLIGVVAPTKSAIVDGRDGKAWNLAATGGNFMTLAPAASTWVATNKYGAVDVPMIEGTIYSLSFDIKLNSQTKVGGSAEFIKFALYTTGAVQGFIFDGEGALVAEDGSIMQVTDLGGGYYNITCRFTYNPANNAGCVRLEALYYNEINYDITLDNIVITEVPMATSETYVYGSNQDVVYNVAFDTAESITVNGVALTADQFAIENGQLIIRAAYAQTVIGSVEIVATLAGGETETFILNSTRQQFVDFEGTFDDGFMAFDILTTTKNEVVDNGIDGKSWNLAATGGNFMTFAPASSTWIAQNLWPATVLEFKTGATYTLSFDIKLNGQYATGTEDAPTQQFYFILHGTDHDAAIYFDKETNELKVDSSRSDRVTVTGGENGVYHVSYEFTYTATGHEGCVRLEADSYQAVSYDILLDNIEILQQA